MIMTITGGPGTAAAPWLCESDCPAETERLGEILAAYLKEGSVVSLEGDLGAGKTVLTRGLARGLGCLGAIASPTFMLLMEHPAASDGQALYHFDAYRLSGADEFTELGLDEYFAGDGVSVVEWGNTIADILPRRTIILRLTRSSDSRPQQRKIAIVWPDPVALLALAADLAGKGTVTCQEMEPEKPC
jgi:tRNA threonylcarbamoyladenosine biosynthesis protein TsaE